MAGVYSQQQLENKFEVIYRELTGVDGKEAMRVVGGI
jgi:hypothetical protein